MTTVFFPKTPTETLDVHLARLRSLPPMQPFSDKAMAFVSAFSRRVMALRGLRDHPELATLAHWFRPAALAHLAKTSISAMHDRQSLARGLVFHVAPANVDVLFAYTWLLSVLCGNTNVARLSQKSAPQRDALLSVLEATASDPEFRGIAERNVLLTYPHDAEITARISCQCQSRIIWGGDQTVTAIRAIPLAPLAVELAFPDRFGIAVFNAGALIDTAEAELRALARRFCNDMLWFGQQACSSPRTLYWVGTGTQVATAQKRFWPSIRAMAAEGFPDDPASLIARVSDAHLMAAMNASMTRAGRLGDYPMRLTADAAGVATRELHSGHGMIVESQIDSLADLPALLDDRDQTMVQIGFTESELSAFLGSVRNRAIDRIVPIGRALDFHPIWDGNDLICTLTRQVTLTSR